VIHYSTWAGVGGYLGPYSLSTLGKNRRENFGTELQQNQKTLQNLKIMVGCRSNSV